MVKTNKLKESKYIDHVINDHILIRGGRKIGIKQLNKIKTQTKYNDTRNTLSIQTTLLSAYIKFGCISIREVYWKLKKNFWCKRQWINFTIILERILLLCLLLFSRNIKRRKF